LRDSITSKPQCHKIAAGVRTTTNCATDRRARTCSLRSMRSANARRTRLPSISAAATDATIVEVLRTRLERRRRRCRARERCKRLAERRLPGADRITPIVSRLEDVPLPIGVRLVNSSFAMPLCEPKDFTRYGAGIVEALAADGRFSGQWYGPRDSWAGRPGMTSHRSATRRSHCATLRRRNVRGRRGRQHHTAWQAQALAYLSHRRAEAIDFRPIPEEVPHGPSPSPPKSPRRLLHPRLDRFSRTISVERTRHACSTGLPSPIAVPRTS
jgi:hypothetical protein